MSPEVSEVGKSPEIKERVVGVGAFIITPDNFFLTIRELTTKRLTGKIAGMRSLPMETVEDRETDEQALTRLFEEEVEVSGLNGLEGKALLCRIQLTNEVWLHTYLIRVPDILHTEVGTDANKISEPAWININEILKSKPSERRFRPGVRESIKSYASYLQDPAGFQPDIYFRCEDEVPQEVFDHVEREAMQITASSQPSYSA